MAPARSKPKPTSPVADRIRARMTEQGYTESSFAEAIGKHRSLISRLLRRIDEGGNIRSDTLAVFERYLGVSAQWIMTGEEPPGIELRSVAGWAAAVDEAKRLYRLAPDVLELIGRVRVPVQPDRLTATFVRDLARTWLDAQDLKHT